MTTPPSHLLSAAAIQALPILHRVHALNPNGVRATRVLGQPVGLSQLGVNIVTLVDGHDSSEYHRHLYEEEAVYVLSGRGTSLIDGSLHAIAAGDFLGFPAGGPAHVLTQAGSEPLVLLVFGQRLAQDVCEYPQQGKRLYIAGDLEAYAPL